MAKSEVKGREAIRAPKKVLRLAISDIPVMRIEEISTLKKKYQGI